MTTQDERPADERPSDPPVSARARAESFEQRAESFGREAEVAANRFGREAEAAAARFASMPAVRGAGNAAARVWGLVLLAVGLWLFASITLNLALPDVAWGDLWPLFLIALGLSVVLGSGRGR